MSWQSCATDNAHAPKQHLAPDTLRVGTLYYPTSFFIYRGDTLGYDYERAKDLAQYLNIEPKFYIASNLNSLVQLLNNGTIDLIAYEVPITAEYRERVLCCGQENVTKQVLVQQKGDSAITNVTQLAGKDIFVEKGSKYESRLINLNDEIGGGINIHAIGNDTLVTEDLIDMVSDGKIALTIVDSDIAKMNKTYYDNIDISLEVSFPQRSSWAVAKNNSWLADTINSWSKTEHSISMSKELLKRYFELSKTGIPDTVAHPESTPESPTIIIPKGAISPFDDMFRKASRSIGWDWRLLAAIGCTESGFNTQAVSWVGARGLMQVMPSTAQALGYSVDDMFDPNKNISAAVKSIAELDKFFRRYISNPQERIRFILASYNAGAGHVVDAIELAKKYDKNPNLWYDNVEEAILWKSNEKFYNDSVCRYGYFKGRQTVNFVKTVEGHYNDFKSRTKE